MTEREQAVLDALLRSKNLRDVAPAMVERVFAKKLLTYKNLKEVDKATRTCLHGITGAFMPSGDIEKGIALADAYRAGDADALQRVLMLHASTRERIDTWRELYAYTYEVYGAVPETVLDLACGLNPIAAAQTGVKTVYGFDCQAGAMRTANAWSGCGGEIRCECADLVAGITLPKAQIALMMKLVPLLEREKTGLAAQLLADCPAEMLLVTYPTRTLGGRNVGMAEQYEQTMRKLLPAGREIVSQKVIGTELCFCIR